MFHITSKLKGSTAVIATATMVLAPVFASASPLGSDPIRLVIPFGPGGGSDITARVLSATAPEFCGPRIDVVSMSGAAGLEAVNFVRSAPANGHTLLVSDYGPVVTSGFVDEVDWSHDDWQPVMNFTEWLPTVYTRPDHDIQTIEDWVAAAESDPGSITFGHANPLGLVHLPLILFEMETGLENIHVPTSGGGETRSLIMGGHIDLGMTLPASIASEVASGELTALGVFSEERSAVLPDTPTFREAGYDVVLPAWLMVIATSDVPAETVEFLQDCFMEALASPTAVAMSDRVNAGIEPMNSEDSTALYQATVTSIEGILRNIGEID
ncbi:Bug family tripartite tricarboxylate transporter substrate binding protein [Roseinatronobacter alkalisoli]|uniref:Tripartite tricarboxylate transporter substrate binding protein n=1 Tax=Roseinatronobacter alkalisoli TaxID=3028235 RepID=A0ABT5T6V6_9RHOB|nr:tripartite tricarboxylate transporter substrate binding protein [Roseinatronobacter sp. HJB301]MDD7970855.1 tripartite tricarboxylate transporter substrate binding protein [Roseinatronobacter sp. HJB301]